MIVMLCGSSRFKPWFDVWLEALESAGHACFSSAAPRLGGASEAEREAHARASSVKIAASQAVLVLNPFAYMGEATLRDVMEARRQGRALYTLESWGYGLGYGAQVAPERVDAARHFRVPPGFGSPTDTTWGESRAPWDLLGPTGPTRASLVELIRRREAALIASAAASYREGGGHALHS